MNTVIKRSLSVLAAACLVFQVEAGNPDRAGQAGADGYQGQTLQDFYDHLALLFSSRE